MDDGKEYGIVVLKPDGIERGVLGLLVSMLEENNLSLITTKEIHMKYEDVIKTIRTRFDNDKYAKYMSKSKVIALLVYGEYAVGKLIDIKQTIRGKFGLSSNDMKNLIHSPDCGNEYYEHFNYLFPELSVAQYGLYADVTVKQCDTDEETLGKLHKLNETSSLSVVGILFEYGKNSSLIQTYNASPGKNLQLLAGIVKECVYKNENMNFIGYLPPKNQTITFDQNDILDDSAECFISWVKRNRGVCILDYRPFNSDSEQLIINLKDEGIDGAVVYDPRFSQEEMAQLEVIVEDDLGLLLTGGTNGCLAIGELAVDRTTFDKFTKVMNSKSIDNNWRDSSGQLIQSFFRI